MEAAAYEYFNSSRLKMWFDSVLSLKSLPGFIFISLKKEKNIS